MKVIILLLSVALSAMAAPEVGISHRNPHGEPHSRYSAPVSHPQSQHSSTIFQPKLHNSLQYNDVPAQYTFQWDVNDQYSGNFYGHQEQRNGPNTQGRYYVRLPDTRLMRVDYYADNYGFHPSVTFEGEALYPKTPIQSHQVIPVLSQAYLEPDFAPNQAHVQSSVLSPHLHSQSLVQSSHGSTITQGHIPSTYTPS
ncbi:pro-resilin-like [Palaemon carinicauda]|uniref:pro-resilin-like n=1 Tax=Palaemon carinicauda TaxID=392227 RepID=UPI0035B57549